jgi:hypothetical protein
VLSLVVKSIVPFAVAVAVAVTADAVGSATLTV